MMNWNDTTDDDNVTIMHMSSTQNAITPLPHNPDEKGNSPYDVTEVIAAFSVGVMLVIVFGVACWVHKLDRELKRLARRKRYRSAVTTSTSPQDTEIACLQSLNTCRLTVNEPHECNIEKPRELEVLLLSEERHTQPKYTETACEERLIEPRCELKETVTLLGGPVNERTDRKNESTDIEKPRELEVLLLSEERHTQPKCELKETVILLASPEKERTDSINKYTETACEERLIEPRCELKETVTLLGGPVNERTDRKNESTDTETACAERLFEPKCELKESADLPDKTLNWNKIFRFLTRKMHADKWNMFFVTLYDISKLPTTKIERVEIDARARFQGIEDVIMEQFKSWKEAAGKNASIKLIEETFEDMGHNDTLEAFKVFMSNPPYLDNMDVSNETNEETQRLNNSLLNDSNPLQTVTLPPGSKLIKETQRISLEMSQNLAEERYEPDGVSLKSFEMTNNSDIQILHTKPALSNPDQTHKPLAMLTSCEQYFPTNVQVYQATGSSYSMKRLRKVRKKSLSVRKTNVKTRKPVRRRKKQASARISPESIALLIEPYVKMDREIKPDMHNFATTNTIDELVKSGIPEDLALRLKYKEYSEIINDTNKRGDAIHSLYIGDELHPLKSSVYEKLKRYVDHVRSKVIRRLTNTNEENYIYIFIDYYGNPLNKKREDMSEDTDSTSSFADSENSL